jgi:hypothetical protein
MSEEALAEALRELLARVELARLGEDVCGTLGKARATLQAYIQEKQMAKKKAEKVKVVAGDDDHEASEAECSLQLLRLGFTIVHKNSTTPVTEEELLEVIRKEAEERRKNEKEV